MMKDDDCKLLRDFDYGRTYGQTFVIVESLLRLKTNFVWKPESQTFVRVAFATEKKFYRIITIIKLKIFYFTVKQIYS